jgi:hypothetical protein
MEADPNIFRVGIRGIRHTGVFDTKIWMAGDVEYRYPIVFDMNANVFGNQFWHGFGFQCGMIRKSHYDLVSPYAQHSSPQEFITTRECKTGLAYYGLGLLAVSLTDDYAIHIGNKRSTYGLQMEG